MLVIVAPASTQTYGYMGTTEGRHLCRQEHMVALRLHSSLTSSKVDA